MEKRKEMLGNKPIKSVLFMLSLPATIAMVVQALYNLVDTIFVGRIVGKLGIGGIAISFPVQMIILGLGMTIGIGGASIISRAFGENNDEKANHTFGNVIVLTVILGVLFTIFGLIYLEPMLILFGATETILPYASDYMSIIFISASFFTMSVGFNNVIRAEGNAKVAMISMLMGAVLNIILDPVFIYFLDMGVKGAAIATALAQFISWIYIISYFLAGKSMLKVKKRHFRLLWDIDKEIIAIGSAAFARQAAGSIMAIVLNKNLGIYGGDVAIAVFGIINRVIMFVFMPMFGLAQGVQPIIGFNYGAKKFCRVKEAINLSVLITSIISVMGFLVIQIFSKSIISTFTQEIQLIEMGSSSIRIVSLAFATIGFQVIGASYYQATGKALKGLILSLARQVLFLIPLVIILSKFFELNGIFIAFPLADFMSFLLTYLLFKRDYARIKEYCSAE